MAPTFVDGGAAARGRAERHFDRCGPRPMTAPPCESHALATDVLTLLAMLRTREQECGRLREQLDAARQALTLAVEQFDEFAEALDLLGHHVMAQAARIVSKGTARAALGVEGEHDA